MANFGGGQPFDYSTVAVDPMTNYTHGVQQASNVINIERADAEYKRNEDVRNQVQALMTSGRPITSAEIAPLIANASPELSQQVAKAHGLLSAEQQQNKLKIASQVMSALQSGDSATAIKTLEEQREAAKNSGDVATEHGAQLMIDQINIDPRKALMHIAVGYGSIPGFDKLLDLSAEVAKRPLEQRKLEAETQSAESRAAADDEYYNARNDSLKSKSTKDLALAEAAKKGKGLGLTAEQSNALYGPGGVVDTGRYNPEKLHKWNAAAIADAEIANPGMTDFLAVAGKARLTTNAKFQQTVADLKMMPTIIDKIEEAGKAVDFSNLKAFGSVEAWAKSQTNSPELTRYMTLRNDIIMTLGKALRGTMTDKAQALEEEAFAKTLAGPALHEWAKAQKEAIKARMDEYEKFTEDKGTHKATEVRATPTGSTSKNKPTHWSELINNG